MAVVAARFRVRLADEPDPTGAVRPHPARPRNLAAIFAPADRMRRSGVHGVRGRARGRRPRHRRAALHGRAAAFGSRRVRVAGRHRRARGARPARHRPPQQDKPGGRDQRRAVREGRRRPEGGLTEDGVMGRRRVCVDVPLGQDFAFFSRGETIPVAVRVSVRIDSPAPSSAVSIFRDIDFESRLRTPSPDVYQNPLLNPSENARPRVL